VDMITINSFHCIGIFQALAKFRDFVSSSDQQDKIMKNFQTTPSRNQQNHTQSVNGILKRLWFPSAIFVSFFLLIFYAKQFFPEIGPEAQADTDRYLNYFFQMGFWISGAVLLNRIIRIFIWERIAARSPDGTVPRLLTDISSMIVFLIAATIIIGFVFNQSLTGFWATSSVVAIILGLALRNIILDLFTGLAINIERPYKIGDSILVHQRSADMNIVGRVVEINWRATRIRTEENTIVVIPNSLISTYVISNFHNSGYPTRFEVFFTIDFSIPTERAKRVLMAGVKESLAVKGFVTDHEPQVLVEETNELGVCYKVRYWIVPWKKISPSVSRDVVNSNILDHLSKSGITPAYPKEDVFYDQMPTRHLDSHTVKDRKQLLQNVTLFNSLNDSERSDLAAKLIEHHLDENKQLITETDQGESMFILFEGLLEVSLSRPEGDLVSVALLKPGSCVGEMSLLTGEPRSATVTALTDAVVFEINKNHMEELFRKRPEIVEKISGMMAERQVYNTRQLEKSQASSSGAFNDEHTAQLMTRIKSFFKGVF